MKKTHSGVKGFCEEFSSHIYEDKLRHSILVNVDQEWFPTLEAGLKKFGYKVCHLTEMPKTVTCVFLKS